MEETIKEEWEDLPQELIDKLCLSWEMRLRKCKQTRGEFVECWDKVTDVKALLDTGMKK